MKDNFFFLLFTPRTLYHGVIRLWNELCGISEKCLFFFLLMYTLLETEKQTIIQYPLSGLVVFSKKNLFWKVFFFFSFSFFQTWSSGTWCPLCSMADTKLLYCTRNISLTLVMSCPVASFRTADPPERAQRLFKDPSALEILDMPLKAFLVSWASKEFWMTWSWKTDCIKDLLFKCSEEYLKQLLEFMNWIRNITATSRTKPTNIHFSAMLLNCVLTRRSGEKKTHRNPGGLFVFCFYWNTRLKKFPRRPLFFSVFKKGWKCHVCAKAKRFSFLLFCVILFFFFFTIGL